MKAKITCAGVALLAGCSCEPALVSRDASFDGAVLDAPIDAHTPPDAYVPPDAFVPLVLTEFDPSPCASVALPLRARALPADATPRVLWTRSLDELGIEGVHYDNGAVDRAGDLHFSTLLFELRGGEISRDGTLLGFGNGANRTKGPLGSMTILPNDRAAEWSDSIIRIDESPPSTSPQTIYWPHDGDPRIDTTGIGMAATSDGLYAYRGYGGGRLRKYCADGRLQWELSGVSSGFIQVDTNDEAWVRGPGRTTLRVDRYGAVREMVNGSVQFAGDSRWVGNLSSDESSVTFVRSVDGVERERFTQPTPRAGFRLDPLGGVWRDVGEPPQAARFVDGVEVARLPLGRNLSPVFGEDGSFISSNYFSDRGPVTVYRMHPDGSIAWEVELPGPVSSITHDIDGRVYLYGGEEITAVQTDVLPPNVRGCWQHRCNALANMSIAPYPG